MKCCTCEQRLFVSHASVLYSHTGVWPLIPALRNSSYHLHSVLKRTPADFREMNLNCRCVKPELPPRDILQVVVDIQSGISGTSLEGALPVFLLGLLLQPPRAVW